MLYAASIDGNIHPEEVEVMLKKADETTFNPSGKSYCSTFEQERGRVMVNIKRERFAVPNLSDVGNLCWFNQLINRMKL